MSDPRTITVAHLGDIHLGRRWLSLPAEGGGNLREKDLERAVALVADEIARRAPSVTVIAGDLFDSTAPSTEARAAACRLVQTLSEASPVVIIGGNHDAARGKGLSPLALLDEFFDCHVALSQETHDVAGVRMHLVPFAALAAQAEGRAPLAPLEIAPDMANLLVAHAAVDRPELDLPLERVLVPDELLADPRLALILLGHIHQHRRLNDPETAFYCGPLERLNFGEASVRPAALIHHLERDRLVRSESVHLDALGDGTLPRPMHRIRLDVAGVDEEQITERAERAAHQGQVEGALISVHLVGCDPALHDSPVPGRIQRRLLQAGALHVEVKLRTPAVAEALDAELAQLPGRLDDALRDYLIAQGHPDLVETALQALGEVT